MTNESIEEAKIIAMSFISAVSEMQANEKPNERGYTYNSPKHRGAVRRRSMDLTRALAEMRRP